MGNSRRKERAIPEGQEILPFRNGRGGGILSYALPWERRFVAGLSALFIVFVALYVYFVMASIVHVAARQELAGTFSSTKAAVSQLETEYLAKTQGITEAYATSVGFVPVSAQAFVERENTVTFHDVH